MSDVWLAACACYAPRPIQPASVPRPRLGGGVPRPHISAVSPCLSAIDLGGTNASATDYGAGRTRPALTVRCLAEAAVAVLADDGAKVAAGDDAVVCIRGTAGGTYCLCWCRGRCRRTWGGGSTLLWVWVKSE